MLTPLERAQIERRIAEIHQQLRLSATKEDQQEANIPYEMKKDEINALYEERDRLIRILKGEAAA